VIEFLPYYQPGAQLLRCLSCSALLVSGDVETHTKWHEEIDRLTSLTVMVLEVSKALGHKEG